MYKGISRLLTYSTLILLAAFCLYPLIYVFINSFKTIAEYTESHFALPRNLQLGDYSYVLFTAGMIRYLINNLLVVPPAIVIYLVVAIPAAFAFGRLRFPLRLPLFSLVLFLMIFPQLLISLQLFRIIRTLKLLNTYPGIILAWVAYFSPFAVYTMATYFSTVPWELIESSRIDGATMLQLLGKVIVPVAMPIIGFAIIIAFTQIWGELIFSMLILQKDGMRTLTEGLALMGSSYGVQAVYSSAATVIATAIPIVVYFFVQRHIITGSYAGAIKG
jgi:raffinose/stachyose/melibiose transport system permease protein